MLTSKLITISAMFVFYSIGFYCGYRVATKVIVGATIKRLDKESLEGYNNENNIVDIKKGTIN